MNTTWRVLVGDVRKRLRELSGGSVQTCVTSPPYWSLRDYGCNGQIGMEATPDAYVAAIVEVFAEVRRVLADDGTLWVNLGDSYATRWSSRSADGRAGLTDNRTGRGGKTPIGFKEKDLIGIPWLVAFALRSDGWYLRSDIIWNKPNAMPDPVQDRPTKSHEYLFLLTKAERYYYDSDAIREPAAIDSYRESKRAIRPWRDHGQGIPGRYGNALSRGVSKGADENGRNKRTVWTVSTQSYEGEHFAAFPPALIEPCILAGSRPGDTVLDPFTGSGTTGAVSIGHRRNFVGVELNPAYVELARERIGAVSPLFAAEIADANRAEASGE